MDEIRWGSIGCGDVMEVKSGPALQNVEHSELIAVMRRDLNLAKDFAQRHQVPKWFHQAEDLVADPEVNAIYIATPPDTHLQYTRMAALAGKPVYVEKPMANSYAQCREMVRICEDQQVPLFVAYYRRALPRFLKVKEIIDSGVLGSIKDVKVTFHQKVQEIDKRGHPNWRVTPEISGCGYFCDLGSHIFDLLQFFLGNISTANGIIGNTGGFYLAEDYIEADFSFMNGISGTGVWNFNSAFERDRAVITGTEGSVSYTHFSEADVHLNVGKGDEIFVIPNPLHIQQSLIQLVVDDLRGKGKCPSTGQSAARTNWVMDSILGRSPTPI